MSLSEFFPGEERPVTVYSSPCKSVQEAYRACEFKGYVTFACSSCKDTMKIQLSCNLWEMREWECQYCQIMRKKTIVAKAMSRYRKVAYKDDELFLWTFGTSLIDTPENREVIRQYWKKFIRRMWHFKQDFDPMMNALEAGTKGKRLHYHVVARGFMKHGLARKTWMDITQEQSNVNFSRRLSTRSALRVFAYLAKYASKGYRYYWMGQMHTLKKEPFAPDPDASVHQHSWEFVEMVVYDNLMMDVLRREAFIARQIPLSQEVL